MRSRGRLEPGEQDLPRVYPTPLDLLGRVSTPRGVSEKSEGLGIGNRDSRGTSLTDDVYTLHDCL